MQLIRSVVSRQPHNVRHVQYLYMHIRCPSPDMIATCPSTLYSPRVKASVTAGQCVDAGESNELLLAVNADPVSCVCVQGVRPWTLLDKVITVQAAAHQAAKHWTWFSVSCGNPAQMAMQHIQAPQSHRHMKGLCTIQRHSPCCVQATARLKARQLPSRKPYFNTGENPDLWFEPGEVWEIRGADLTISPVHMSAVGRLHPSRGVSMRWGLHTLNPQIWLACCAAQSL